MQKLDISIAVPGLPFNGESFSKQSLGGSETAGYYMARELARMGHRVTVFCRTEPKVHADVNYLPLEMWQSFVQYTPHDVAIVQRSPQMISAKINARLTVLWCHDLALLRQEPLVKGTAWNYDKLMVLSQFMFDQYKTTYSVPEQLLYKTRNGVDNAFINMVGRQHRNDTRRRNHLLYAARPERGLDVLLEEIMPRVLKGDPSAKLFLCSYDNPVDHLAEFYAKCDAAKRALGDAVIDCGSLTKEQLYRLMMRCGAYVYPTPSKTSPNFDEISCISLMEAQACGLPVVTTNRGALPETLGPGAGVLIEETVHTDAYYDAFAGAVLSLAVDEDLWKAHSNAARAHAANLDWRDVAEDWSEMFEREIRAQSAHLPTLANHFWRRSDIYAAEAVIAKMDPADVEKYGLKQRIEPWAFIHEEDGFRKQYETIGATHNPAVFDVVKQEKRYQALKQFLQDHPEIERILDYGCAHGSYALNLAEELGVKIVGIDIDKHSIAMAKQLREEKCSGGGLNCEFYTLEEFGVIDDFSFGHPNDNGAGRFDAVLAFEVLEHVAEPWKLLATLEQHVKNGGHLIATVPFGPWEYESYFSYPYRCHVWEFDLQDLHEMLDVKGRAAVQICSMPSHPSPVLGDVLGWWFINYTVSKDTRGQVGTIDMERKLWLQRPRQTVSASIIAGANCEETLHWCLRSLAHVADEIVIVDCGMTYEATRIVNQYPFTYLVKNGPDPKTQGFETPRNIGLAQCVMDWVLWIDTDEKLMDGQCVTKYLRSNVFQGYSVRQHHFAVDTTFTPDMPIRLFRNNGKLRFFGMIHEHPETELNKGPGLTIVLGDVCIAHVGYLIESGRRARFTRNYPMLQADIERYPDRLLQKHFIMRDNMLLCQYEMLRNGGRITDGIKAKARETVELYRTHFLGKSFLSNTDPLQYYTQALTILGEGFEMKFQVAADRVEARLDGIMSARFATPEEAVSEVTKRTRELVQPFANPYY